MGLACLAGYLWLVLSMLPWFSHGNPGICIFKNITGIPCPSCGATRAVTLLLHGDVAASLLMNPVGITVAAVMAVVPLWLAFDVLQKKQTLFDFYTTTERYIRKPRIALVLITLVLVNWVWGISKGL